MKINYKVLSAEMDEVGIYGNVFKKGELITCYYKGIWEIESIKKRWDGKAFIEYDLNDIYGTAPDIILKKAYSSTYVLMKGKKGTRRTVHLQNLGKLVNTYTYKEKLMQQTTDSFNKLKEIYENQLQKQATV